MHIILKNAQSMQSVDADAEWRPGQGLNHGNWQLAQIVHALLKVCTLICAKMHTDLCRNAENLSKCTTTLQHASGLGVEETQAWFRTDNFWCMLCSNTDCTVNSVTDRHTAAITAQIKWHKLCFARTRPAHCCRAKTNEHNIKIFCRESAHPRHKWCPNASGGSLVKSHLWCIAGTA